MQEKAFHEDYFLDNSQRDILNDSNAEDAEKSPKYDKDDDLAAIAFGIILILLIIVLSNWHSKLSKKLASPKITFDEYCFFLTLFYLLQLARGLFAVFLCIDVLFYFKRPSLFFD